MKAAGGVLTAKQAPHRPGTAPAPGLRAEECTSHCTADRSMREASPMTRRTRLSVETLNQRCLPSFSWYAEYPVAEFEQAAGVGFTYGDNKKEAAEYFYVDLYDNSSNSLFTKNRGTGAILNDD